MYHSMKTAIGNITQCYSSPYEDIYYNCFGCNLKEKKAHEHQGTHYCSNLDTLANCQESF